MLPPFGRRYFLSIYLSIYLSVCLSVCLSIYLSIYLYYIDTAEIPGFFLLLKNHLFIARSEDTIFSGPPARAKRAWDRAPFSWNMVNLFSFGCHAIDRAYVSTYVRTRLQIVRVESGRLSKGREGCLRRVLASPHL